MRLFVCWLHRAKLEFSHWLSVCLDVWWYSQHLYTYVCVLKKQWWKCIRVSRISLSISVSSMFPLKAKRAHIMNCIQRYENTVHNRTWWAFVLAFNQTTHRIFEYLSTRYCTIRQLYRVYFHCSCQTAGFALPLDFFFLSLYFAQTKHLDKGIPCI